MLKQSSPWSRTPEVVDTTIGWRFPNPKLTDKYHPYTMGETAENVAMQWKITREEQDEFAFQSHSKYYKAKHSGRFKDEIIPVEINGGKEPFAEGVPM